MTDAERQAFLNSVASRAPGKRQVKPNLAFLSALQGGGDHDESDEDFPGPQGSDDSENEKSEAGSSSDSSEDSDEEDENTSNSPSTSAKNDDEDLVIIPPDREADKQAGIGVSNEPWPLICTLCLNLRETQKDKAVITCDKCGIAVHEECYMVEDMTEMESQDSTATTEPWFCEPCLFRLDEPPYCEYCPNRYGAFKRSDIGGQWVHLLCALFTPDTTFGDPERLTAVSWQEMDHRRFGRKPCSACTNKLVARTGITTGCESAMCKNFFHITCAQKLGLLVDVSENEYSYHMDPYYLMCKKHSNSDQMRMKRENYARMVQQEESRLAIMKRKRLDPREMRKKEKQKELYLKRMKEFSEPRDGHHPTIAWPNTDDMSKREKRVRLIQTSARFYEAFAEKAELAGASREDFDQAFLRIPTEQLPILPPSFTDDFFRYYQHRETVLIPEEEANLEEAKKRRDQALREQRMLEQTIRDAGEKAPGKRSSADVNKVRLSKFYNALKNLGVKSVKKPRTPSPISRMPGPQPGPSTSASSTSIKVLKKPTFTPKTKPNILRKVSPTKVGSLYQKTTETPLLDTSFPPKDMPRLDMNGPKLETTTQLNGVYSPLLEHSKHPMKPSERPKIYENGKKGLKGKRSRTRTNSTLVSSPDSAMKPPELDRYTRSSVASRTESRISNLSHKEEKPEKTKEVVIHECFKCKANTDQHLLIYCNTCKNYYHLGCLDPPLKKMPKIRPNETFECSDCAYPSESEEDEKEEPVVEEDPDSTIATRRPKRERSNLLMEQRKRDEEEMERAYRSAMAQNRHKRPRPPSNRISQESLKSARSPTPKKVKRGSQNSTEVKEENPEMNDTRENSQEL